MFWKKKDKYITPHANDANFNEIVTKSDIPVLVDFYADWCGPCKILGPIIDELSEEYKGRAKVIKVNTQNNPALSSHFKIKSIPTIMIFNKGHFQEKFHGLIPKPNLEEILEEYIAGTDDNGRIVDSDQEE